jgi:hypothetical protein
MIKKIIIVNVLNSKRKNDNYKLQKEKTIMKENHEVKLLTNPMLKDKINKKKLISKKDPNHKKKE